MKIKVCEVYLDTETGEFDLDRVSELPRFQDMRGMIDSLQSVVSKLTRRLTFIGMQQSVEEWLNKNGPAILRGGNGAPKIVTATAMPSRTP